jgi:hypothetical protein
LFFCCPISSADVEVPTNTLYCTMDGWRRPFEIGVHWRQGWKIEVVGGSSGHFAIPPAIQLRAIARSV